MTAWAALELFASRLGSEVSARQARMAKGRSTARERSEELLHRLVGQQFGVRHYFVPDQSADAAWVFAGLEGQVRL